MTRLNVGGPTRHISLLNTLLPECGIDGVTLTGPTPPTEGSGAITVQGRIIEITTLERAVSIWADIQAFFAILRILRKEKPDVVHTHQSKAGFLGRWAAWCARVPRVVHTFHGLAFRGYAGVIGSWWIRFIERVTLRVTDVVICQNSLQEEELIDAIGFGVRAKSKIVEPAIEIPARANVEQSIPRRVVFAARLVPIKDPDLLLAVVELTDPAVHFDVVGDGVLMTRVRAKVSANPLIRHRVKFWGNIAEPWDIYQQASVGILTSVAEGTPLALIELQALGTRVVAPDVGGVRGIVDPRAGEVVQRTAVDLAAAVMRQLALGRVTDEARSEIRQKYDGLRLATEVAAIYRA